LPTTAVSPPGRSARRTSSAAAATALGARAPLVRLLRCCATEAASLPAALQAQARASTPQRVSVSVRLVKSSSATAHAQRPVRRLQSALTACASVPVLILIFQGVSAVRQTPAVAVQPTTTVLRGSFVQKYLGGLPVFQRARGSASHSLGLT
jgi:hypothetical protein